MQLSFDTLTNCLLLFFLIFFFFSRTTVNCYFFALVSSARARPSYVRQPQQAKEQNGQVEQPPQEPKKSVIPTGKMQFFSLLYPVFFIYIYF